MDLQLYAVPAVLRTYGGSKLGYSHEHNEDRFVIEEDLGVLCGVGGGYTGGGGRPSHRTALLAVFDGHGGAGAAPYLQRCVAGALFFLGGSKKGSRKVNSIFKVGIRARTGAGEIEV